MNYLKDFKNEVTDNFVQWIDGSYVTQKVNPRDIDFVNLIDHKVYTEKRELIDNKFRLLKAREIYEVDAYTVECYPKDKSEYEYKTKADLIYWDNFFGKTRKNRAGRKQPKGYIEIKFGKGIID